MPYSNRAIAREINCSPSTVGYELKRGTLEYSGKVRKPKYSSSRGQASYIKNRSKSCRKKEIKRESRFIDWLKKQVKLKKWSFDVCVGYARLNQLFPEEKIPCTKTLYNLLWNGELDLTAFDLPEALGRRKRGKPRVQKRNYGKSIDLRPLEVLDRNTFGHWESDTIQGKKKKGEAAVFSIVERLTGCYLTIRIDEKNVDGVETAMRELETTYGAKFSQIFKSITTDNSSEFVNLAIFERLGTKIYYAHPYASWERPVNERSNRLFRKYVPKVQSITKYTANEILSIADEINATPRKRLGYLSPEDLFERELDRIYSL